MTEPATETLYPGALDTLPHVPANAREWDEGLEHDVLHSRANAILNALQVLVGFGVIPASGSVLARIRALEQSGGGGAPGGIGGLPMVSGTSPPQLLHFANGELFHF